MTFTPPHLLDGSRWAGLRIGLLGGSFNPAHAGHVHISQIALHTLQLDFIWWLVTPHNPLKDKSILAPMADRIAQSRALIHNPRILVTDLEQQLGVNKSIDTVIALKHHFPRTSFIWLTGMDNAVSFHRWHRWRDILNEMATAHIARPPAASLVGAFPLRMMGQQAHTTCQNAGRVSLEPGRSYWLLQKHLMDISSTEIRKTLL